MKCILVVDDEYAIAEGLEMILELEGYRVALAGDGAEALEVLERKSVDLVLMDVMMPIKSGIDALDEIRADERLQELPVVMMSAAPDAYRGASEESGASAFVRKPFDVEQLLRVIEENLQATA